ncbi:hypothetical protein BY458DRAFT_529000 [Sporodiniella umbellata]|nr:hypothetical protein BY458DRAFT_529000 [Sporodiniella umbellata]
MTVFEKITGLAVKAKDNALSKATLSKDKRLENSLSEKIQAEDISLKKMSTYGLSSSVKTVAYDCVSGLLAVAGGSEMNHIKFFGRGISTAIELPGGTELKYMQFKTGASSLVAIDKTNTIMTVDLQTQKISSITPAAAIITSQAYCPGTDWLFIGYANGFVDVFDILLGTITQYQIPDLLPEEENNRFIVDLQLHPIDLNILLIGYESVIYIWDIREKVIKKSFSLRRLESDSKSGNLTCLSWSPNGFRFIGGYDDGYIHLWDLSHEKRPITSRKLFQHYTSSSEIEPIYQIAWFTNELERKSFVVLAGGAHPADTLGLNLLEFDYDGEAKEPKKQTIMPISFELSHFLILSANPYYGGMRNPFGIVAVGSDCSITMFAPPALEFLVPPVVSACFLPQLPENAYKILSAVTKADKNVRHAPISGGLTGPDHVYRIDSNDILLTIHQDESIKFWDASYTALRPLSHLTIHPLADLGTREAIVCCIDINKTNGTCVAGFSTGELLVYEHFPEDQEERSSDAIAISVHDEAINQCDNTLKEIAELLEDMNTDEENTEHNRDDKNPFLLDESNQENSASTRSPHQNTVESLPAELPQDELKDTVKTKASLSDQSKIFSKPDHQVSGHGYQAVLKVSLGSIVRSVTSIGECLIAVALDDGRVVLVDIHRQMILFSENIIKWDTEHEMPAPPAKDSTGEPKKNPKNNDIYISFIGFFNTYASSKITKATPHLFICLSNGHVYQFSVLLLLSGVSIDNMSTHLCIYASASLLDLKIIDINGEEKSATSEVISEDDEVETQNDNSQHPLPSDTVDENTVSFSSPSIKSTNSSGVSFTSKRMAALGKSEYRQQDNPHFVICVSSLAVNVYLSGFGIKLFNREFKDSEIVQSQIVQKHSQGVCLFLLLDNGRLLCYSLPKLEPLYGLNLLEKTSLKRLHEASFSEDGRIVVWTGKYEMEQYQFMSNTKISCGESVILHDAHRQLPIHPSLALKRQKSVTKKSWLNAVAEAFQKEPLKIHELDSLMGRVTNEDIYAATKKKIEAHKLKMSQSKSSGPSGVFAELGNKVNERGEKLNELNQKFSEMNAASGDFLKAVKEYNERQARKKWWEF